MTARGERSGAGDEERPILGWDVGGTKSAAVVASPGGEVLDRREWPSRVERGWQAMLEEFLERLGELGRLAEQAAGLGVSIGGPLNPLTGVILGPPHLPGWHDVPLAEILQRRLGLPVVVEHDAVTCLLAECLWGAARGAASAIYLTCGTGCGAGILTRGQIVRGPAGQSPEVGHVRLAPDGPPIFGKAGCVESFCGGEGISKLAPFLYPGRFTQPVEPRRLAELAAAGEDEARAVLMESARRTGQLCALLADIFSPQVIVLGSLARYLPPWWRDEIIRSFHEEALPANSAETRIVPAELAERLQDLSAAAGWIWRQRHGA